MKGEPLNLCGCVKKPDRRRGEKTEEKKEGMQEKDKNPPMNNKLTEGIRDRPTGKKVQCAHTITEEISSSKKHCETEACLQLPACLDYSSP